MKSDFAIRNLQPDDAGDWRQLWLAYCAFYQVDVPEEVTQRTWSMLMDQQSAVHGRVLVWQGRCCGIAHHVVHPATWTLTDVCYLEDLFVLPELRGQGAGRALLDDLLDLCRLNGWSRLYWHTDAANATARRLYDRYATADRHVRYRLSLR